MSPRFLAQLLGQKGRPDFQSQREQVQEPAGQGEGQLARSTTGVYVQL